MSPEDELAGRLRRALYAHKAEGGDLDHEDEDAAVEAARRELGATMSDFLDGAVNFNTVKYRLDGAFSTTSGAFPTREVVEALSELVLSVDVDDLTPAMRSLGRAPEDLPEAKGRLLDAEEFVHREASKGTLKAAYLDRLMAVLLCLWHLQAPGEWPLRYPALLDRLRREGLVGRTDPVDDTIDYAAAALRLAEATGADAAVLPRLLPLLDGELPPDAECVDGSRARAREAVGAGWWDGALGWWGLVLAFDPLDREALEGRIAAYEGKGLHMMAVAEAEALVELLPRDLAAHRLLLALYKGRGMIRDYNAEVRRFKALMLPGPDK